MRKTVRVAINLPQRLAAEVDEVGKRRGVSRSALIRHALAEYVRLEQERAWNREYVEAYRRMPETAGEIATSEALTAESRAKDPWEDE